MAAATINRAHCPRKKFGTPLKVSCLLLKRPKMAQRNVFVIEKGTYVDGILLET